MPAQWNDTRLPVVLGIEHPIVLGPFGGLSSVALAARVSERGGLGSYGLYGYSAERIEQTAAELRAATDAPVALNVWLPLGTEVEARTTSDAAFEEYVRPLRPYFDRVGLVPPGRPASYLPSLDEQLAAVFAARPAVLSVVFGVPSAEVIDRAHAQGTRVIGTATTVAEAVALDAAGVDAVVASGFEAGGHRVSFLRPAHDSLVGSFSLLPQVVDAVSVPVIAAGGVADARGVAAAAALGAAGVQVGTAFLATRESAAPASHRAAIRAARDDGTVLTDVMSGRLARGVPNEVVRELTAAAGTAGDTHTPFPAQNWLTGRFRAAAATLDDGELLSLWAGQSAALSRYDTADEVFDALLR